MSRFCHFCGNEIPEVAQTETGKQNSECWMHNLEHTIERTLDARLAVAVVVRGQLNSVELSRSPALF